MIACQKPDYPNFAGKKRQSPPSPTTIAPISQFAWTFKRHHTSCRQHHVAPSCQYNTTGSSAGLWGFLERIRLSGIFCNVYINLLRNSWHLPLFVPKATFGFAITVFECRMMARIDSSLGYTLERHTIREFPMLDLEKGILIIYRLSAWRHKI